MNKSCWSYAFVLSILFTFTLTYCVSVYYDDVSKENFTLSQSINKSKKGNSIAMRIGQVGISITAIFLLLAEFHRKEMGYQNQRMCCAIMTSILMVSVAFNPLASCRRRHFLIAGLFFLSTMCYVMFHIFITRNPIILCLLLTQLSTMFCMCFSKYKKNKMIFSMTEVITVCLLLIQISVMTHPSLLKLNHGSCSPVSI